MNLKKPEGRQSALMSLRMALATQRQLTQSIALACKPESAGHQKCVKAGELLDEAIRELNTIGQKDV